MIITASLQMTVSISWSQYYIFKEEDTAMFVIFLFVVGCDPQVPQLPLCDGTVQGQTGMKKSSELEEVLNNIQRTRKSLKNS